MKNIFVKSALVLSAIFTLTGCTVSEYQYDSSDTGSDYSINIVDKSDITEAPEIQETEAPEIIQNDAPEIIQTEAPVIEETAAPEISEEEYSESSDTAFDDYSESSDTAFDDYSDDTYIEYYFRTESQLEQHFSKHGYEFEGDFNYETAEDYENGASDVINNPDALYKTEAEDGDGVYYLEGTNEFVVLSTDGYIRTYFRPSAGIDYFNRQ
ncbi:MAG: hypothetical protein J6A57_01295 [Ruminococcus sp.]|nr:hypothetical protein [Ruminococcus sp.]